MLGFFLNILRQRTGSYVKVQLLQTLSIMFENIKSETAICACRRVRTAPYGGRRTSDGSGRGGGAWQTFCCQTTM